MTNAKSKMKPFVTKSSNLDFAVVLDTPMRFFIIHYKLTKYIKWSSQFLNR